MTLNLGMVRPGSTILVPFNTFDSNDPSASVAIAAFVLADIGIYKGTSMTERASTTGVVLLDTDGIDIDAAVGIGGYSIDLSSNATAGFYAAGSHYYSTVGPVTVDAAVVNFVAATFSIGYPNAIINTTVASVTSQTQFILTVGPAEADALIGCKLLFHDVASAVQVAYAYVTDYAVTTKEVTCTDPVGFTFAATDNVSIFLPDNVHAVQGTTQTAGDIAALIATAQADLDIITGAAGAIVDSGAASVTVLEDAIWDAVLTGASHSDPTSAGRRLRQIEEAFIHASGVIATVTNGHTFTLDTGAVATADYYIGDRLQITEGTGAGQSRVIIAYSAGRVAILDSDYITNPDTSSLYEIDAADVHVAVSDSDLAEGFVAVATSTTTITLDATNAVATDDYYNGEQIIFTQGTGAGQSREITDYTSGRVVTMSPALETAVSTDTVWHIQAAVSIPEIVSEVLTTQMTESYAANGVAPTLAQAQFAVHQMLMQFGISGTSLTVRKLDNTTTAFIVTLDDATSPTDAKRV